jgi:hypothetical protein
MEPSWISLEDYPSICTEELRKTTSGPRFSGIFIFTSRPPHSYTYSHSHLRLTPNLTLLFLHYNENINTGIHTVLRIENITILPTVFTTSKIKAFTQILKDCRTM